MPRNVPVHDYHERKRRQFARQVFAFQWVQRFRGCAYCLRWLTVETLTIDHVVPRARGGPDKMYNWVGCCYDCNQEKGPKIWTPAVDSSMLGIDTLDAIKGTSKQKAKKCRKRTKRLTKLMARKSAREARKRKAALLRQRKRRRR